MEYVVYNGNTQSSLTLRNYHLPIRLSPISSSSIMHSHRFLEISVLKTGSGIYKVEDRFYEMSKGDIFLFNNIEKHGIYQIDAQEPMLNMCIHFDPSFIYSSSNNYFDYRFLKIFFEQSSSFQNRMDSDSKYTSEVHRLLLEMEQEFIQKQTGYELAVKVKLLDILVILIRYFGYSNAEEFSDSLQKKPIELVQTLVEYIHQHYNEDITLDALAKVVNLNASYLSSIFTKYNGIPLWTYLSKTRVGRAKEYLRASNKGILEIASLCGFNNTSNFNRIFKQITGLTPTQYRKEPMLAE